jgi:hypothetical protein
MLWFSLNVGYKDETRVTATTEHGREAGESGDLSI